MKYFFVAFLLILSFFSGVLWERHRVIEGGALELRVSLNLSGGSGDPGVLPKGTVLYPYSTAGSHETFVVFVNTKELSLLEPVNFKNYLTVSPVEAYSE